MFLVFFFFAYLQIFHLCSTVKSSKKREVRYYGKVHIKQHHKCRYNTLLVEAKLNTYLYEIDVQAHSTLDDIIANLARKRGIDEELKDTDMLKWVAEMNNIKAVAEEIVLREIIYQ